MKKLLAILLTVLSLFAFTSCLSYRDPDDPTGQGNLEVLGNIELNPDSGFEGEIKIAAPEVESHKTALNAFIKSFGEKFPKIKVKTTYMELNSYKSSISRVAASAQQLNDPSLMYDIFWLSQDYINEWLSVDILSPLQELVEKDVNISTDDLQEQAVAVSSANGKLYMMPRDYNQVVMYYNKDMFDAAKVSYPTDGMSGAEFKSMCEKLATNLAKCDDKYNDYGSSYSDAVSCIVDSNICWNSLCYPLVKSFGGRVTDEEGQVLFNSENTLNALKYWKSFVDTKMSGIPLAIGLSEGASYSGRQFRMQSAPIYLHSRAVMSDILNEVTMAGQTYRGVPKLGVAALPNFGGEYAIGAGCSGYAMYTDTVNGTAAWQFLKHVVSVEGQNAYSETGDCVPVRTSMLNDPQAIWRNCLKSKLDTSFHHDAFIYEMDTAFTSVTEFYQYIPFAAQVDVASKIEDAFNVCIPSVEKFMPNHLQTIAENMQTIIDRAKN